MDKLFSGRSIGISELREAPGRAFAQAGDEAVVVLNHNQPPGYILANSLMARLMEQLADRVVSDKVRGRMPSLALARKISLDEL